jgi:hypothetical protein
MAASEVDMMAVVRLSQHVSGSPHRQYCLMGAAVWDYSASYMVCRIVLTTGTQTSLIQANLFKDSTYTWLGSGFSG